MRLIKVKVVVSFTGFLMLLASAVPVSAASLGCSFKKTVQQAGYAFDVSSRPADGCGVQIIRVIARRGGKQIATFKTDVDFLATAAWAADLNGDGKPELAVASKSAGKDGRGSFDVYWLEGKTLQRASMPENEEGGGYLGHDGFTLDKGVIVRSFPLYREGDPDNSPSGGTQTLRYLFRDGQLALQTKSGAPAAVAATANRALPRNLAAPRKSSSRALPVEGYPRAAPPEFYLPKPSTPLAPSSPKATVKHPVRPSPAEGYPRAAPPEFYLQQDKLKMNKSQ